MKEKTKLRIIQVMCIISILITIFSIQRTYAKYFEKVDTTYKTQIKRWLINVNTYNIVFFNLYILSLLIKLYHID